MLAGLEPVYNRLYKILYDQFGAGDQPMFKTFEKGFQYKERKAANKDIYPWAFLSWGRPGRVRLISMPRHFGYVAIYPLILMTWANEGGQDKLIYNEDPPEMETNPGIGDLIAKVSTFLWDGYRDGFFAPMIIRDPDPEVQPKTISVPQWNVEGAREPSLSYVRPLLINPFIRAAQIDFSIEIHERTN